MTPVLELSLLELLDALDELELVRLDELDEPELLDTELDDTLDELLLVS